MLPVLASREAPGLSSSSGSSNATAASARHASKKAPGPTITTTTTAAALATSSSGSPPNLMGGGNGSSSPTGGSSASSSSTGCVRWCMNVALQSFTGEPWAVTLQPAAEDECVLNGSFPGTPSDGSIASPSSTSAHPTTTTTTTTAASSSVRQHPLPCGQGNSTRSGSGSNRSSPVPGGFANTRMSPSMLRSGLQLAAVDYSEPQVQYPGGPVLDATMFGYDPLSEDTAALHQCVLAVNSPPVTYGVDDLLGRITNVEFIAEQSSPEETAAGVPMHYRLASSLEPMLNATLNPAITAVVDHCVNAMVLVYGATQEMKQMGLIGTPEECGLLPHGIRSMMDRFAERKEQQQSKASSSNGSPKSSAGDRSSHHNNNSSSSGGAGGGHPLASPPLQPSGAPSASHSADDVVSDGERTDGAQSRGTTSQAYSFVFPSIGSRHHRFVRMESTFIAFDSTSVVDLLDLSNKRVELVLKLAPPPTPSAFEEKADDVNSPSGSSATTDSYVLNARAMPVENTNDALSALDVGLENLSRALELSLLQSESGSSLLFSLTAFTDTCRCATMHVLCLAEDPAAQTWLASTVQARSQAIPLGEEQSWASIQNTPMPPPLHHHAATMLVPALCFGNMFTSVLICVYNSITALSRLNRDLTFAVTGYRMRTIPRVTLASSRRGLKKLPPSWEEYFTSDGRRYFIDTATQTTTWEDPRFTYQQRPSRSSSANGGGGGGAANGGGSASRTAAPQHRPSRIGLGSGDRDYLASRLQAELHGNSGGVTPSTGAAAPGHNTGKMLPSPSVSPHPPSAAAAAAAAGLPSEEPLDIGIVVVDTMCRPRVLIGSSNPRFAMQYVEEERALRDKQRELEETMEAMRKEAEKQRRAAAAAAAAAKEATSRPPASGQTAGVSQRGVVDDCEPSGIAVTATPSECMQNIADPTAPLHGTDFGDLPPSPVSGLIGLDDVDDEEVSSLCRDSTANVDDFVFDDDDEDDDDLNDEAAAETEKHQGKEGGAMQLFQSAASTSAGPAPSAAATTTTTSGNAEARFYANALQEQAVGVAEMTASAAASASSSVPATPHMAAASSGSLPTPKERGGSTKDLALPSAAVAPVPPEVQDMESLVDEFTTFYRTAYAMQQRVMELEAELRQYKKAAAAAAAPTTAVADSHARTGDAPKASARPTGRTETMEGNAAEEALLEQMRDAVAASPSAEVRQAVLPLLDICGGDANRGGVVLSAFQEALRLAARTT